MADEGEFLFEGPDFDFEFSTIDSSIFNLYSYRILVFKIDRPQGHVEATNVLKIALQKLVQRCPPLGGAVIYLDDQPGVQRNLKKVKPGNGIKLVVRDLRLQLNYANVEAENFPCAAFKCDEVVPISPAPIMEGDAPGSVFQFTWIEGGALLTVGINHSIADGNGMNTIMGLLAEECRTVQSSSDAASEDKAILGIDRTPAMSLESKTKARPEDHISYTFLAEPPLSNKEDHGEGPHIDMYMFQIAPEKLIALKEASKSDLSISTHDAICALTWRSVMLARYRAGTIRDLDADVDFHLPTDARRFVGINKDYIGNMVYYVTCKMPLRELINPNSLPIAAKMIRTQLEARNAELVSGYLSLIKSLPYLSQMTFGWVPRVTTTAFSMGSSWKADQMYGADWGSAFGPVRRFRSPDVGFFGIFQGMTFVCPRLPGSGTAEFQTWLEPAGWKALQEDKLFSRFCTRVGA